MEIVINIDEKVYNNIEPFLNGETINGGINLFKTLEIIKNGTPLPKGHGRLGDLDALQKEVSSWGMNDYEPSDFIDVINEADTIIEADTESEDKPKTDRCKDCKWRKDIDEVFRRGVSMEDLCAACYVRNKK